uniref:BPTI/Kunitz inhibitor domain-containing protein n=1 Tax=Chrysemys picta bellii TaxID=8478 RepID=A0A8C3FGL1_CHRPI
QTKINYFFFTFSSGIITAIITARQNAVTISFISFLYQGSCRVYIIKWYYDKQANACAQFWYGGCDGNANRFDVEDECKKACVFHSGGKTV